MAFLRDSFSFPTVFFFVFALSAEQGVIPEYHLLCFLEINKPTPQIPHKHMERKKKEEGEKERGKDRNRHRERTLTSPLKA